MTKKNNLKKAALKKKPKMNALEKSILKGLKEIILIEKGILTEKDGVTIYKYPASKA